MKSKLHSKLQERALDYLGGKSYWVKAIEMPCTVGIIDAWGMSRANKYETMAIEVKVSRGDHRSRSQKYKESYSGRIANQCYILCPAGLIQPEDVNQYWGLLWYVEGKKLINKKKAIKLEMTAHQKLETIIHFLSSGINQPKLVEKELEKDK